MRCVLLRIFPKNFTTHCAPDAGVHLITEKQVEEANGERREREFK
jgi:hypothetical protein